MKKQFSILDHINQLKPAKGKDRYHCPVCDGNDLTIDLKTGSYQCWHGCKCRDIREALSPWDEYVKSNKEETSNFNKPKITQKPKLRTNSMKYTDKIKLATLIKSFVKTEVIANPKISEFEQNKYSIPSNCSRKIIYSYSENQSVVRFEWIDPSREKGYNKITLPQHKNNQGYRYGKGDNSWSAYRLDVATQQCQGKFVLAVEGETCVEAALANNIAAITWQGGSWRIDRILPTIKALKSKGASGLVYLPDNDETGTKKAKIIANCCSQENFPCLVLNPLDVWEKMPHKGDIVDFLEAHRTYNPTKLLTDSLYKAIFQKMNEDKTKENSHPEDIPKTHKNPIDNWSQDNLAEYLAKKFKDKIIYNAELKEWLVYELENEGIWKIADKTEIENIFLPEVRKIKHNFWIPLKNGDYKNPTFTMNFLLGIIRLTKAELLTSKWEPNNKLIPFKNGVYDPVRKVFLPHSSSHNLTWCLPYKYDLKVQCLKILKWLVETCNNDRQIIEVLLAYLNCLVHGRYDIQKFLEIYGCGGSGKGTFTRIATALVGERNTHETSLKHFENRFESANLAYKKLALLNDEEKYTGTVVTLKNITGGDKIRYEKKYQQAALGFTFEGLVIFTVNELIHSNDLTSGLARRRITIPFNNKVEDKNRRTLITFEKGIIKGEFAPEIPGLMNLLLSRDIEKDVALLKDYKNQSETLKKAQLKALVETNSIAHWFDSNIIFRETSREAIGIAYKENSHYPNRDIWLYPNYCQFCLDTGVKPLSLVRFRRNLEDLLINQLKFENIKFGRDRNNSYLQGVKIRGNDLEIEKDEPCPITEYISSDLNTENNDEKEKSVEGEDTILENLPVKNCQTIWDRETNTTYKVGTQFRYQNGSYLIEQLLYSEVTKQILLLLKGIGRVLTIKINNSIEFLT